MIRILLLACLAALFGCSDKSFPQQDAEKAMRHHFEITFAVNNNDLKKAKELLEDGLDPNVGGVNDGINSIHMSAYMHQLEMLKLFAEYGGDFTLADLGGNNALHYAAESSWCRDETSEKAKVLFFLLKQGADPEAKNRNGQTPAALAATKAKDPVAAKILGWKDTED